MPHLNLTVLRHLARQQAAAIPLGTALPSKAQPEYRGSLPSLFMMPNRPHRETLERKLVTVSTVTVWLAGLAVSSLLTAAEPPAQPKSPPGGFRRNNLPRKVLLGTVMTGYEIFSLPLEQRLDKMDELVDEMATQARRNFPAKRLDLAVLPELFLARPDASPAQQAVPLEEVRERIAACAKRHGCYLIVPILLQEAGPPLHSSNAAVLLDRQGRVLGIYRKVHLASPQGTSVLNGGLPGREFPVFDCDFGRVGIQLCWDMMYPDGWQALAKQGAEIVALPTASPQTIRPSLYALQHQYYVVSAAPRDHAAIISPLGLIEAEITQNAVLVHQIDLSYAILAWASALEEGAGLRRRYGDKVGYHYYRPEDSGIFWSNDPGVSIGQMIGSLGLSETNDDVERVRLLEDKVRGGPPVMP